MIDPANTPTVEEPEDPDRRPPPPMIPPRSEAELADTAGSDPTDTTAPVEGQE